MSHVLLIGAVLAVIIPLLSYYFVFLNRKTLPATGKAILVTGAASGIGKQICEDLLQKGCIVYAADRSMDALKAGWPSFDQTPLPHKSSKLEFLEMDVTNKEHIDAAVMKVEASGTGLFGVVNSAGISLAPGYPMDRIQSLIELDSDTTIQPVLNVNLLGTTRVNSAFFPLLWQSKGVIINISSVLGHVATAGVGAYGIAKTAIVGYSDAIRRELAPYGIRVACIAPGFTRTAMTAPIFHPEYLKYPRDYGHTRLTKGRGDEGLWARISGGWEALVQPSVVSETIITQLFQDPVPAHTIIDNRRAWLFYLIVELLPSVVADWILSTLKSKNVEAYKSFGPKD